MTNYREILRLHSLGLNKTEIAASLHCAHNTVTTTLQRAGNCGLQWPLPDEMSDRQLTERLFPSAPWKPVYKMPNYAYVYREMQKSGVTLNLLWLEYCDQCKASGEIPYQSTQFNKYYSDYLNKTNATMHLNHKPGEVMQVDWAGDTASIIDTDTGEVLPAYVFVATLPYSGYSYDTKHSIVCQYSIRAVALFNLVGATAQFKRNDCLILPVEVIWRGGVRKVGNPVDILRNGFSPNHRSYKNQINTRPFILSSLFLILFSTISSPQN